MSGKSDLSKLCKANATRCDRKVLYGFIPSTRKRDDGSNNLVVWLTTVD